MRILGSLSAIEKLELCSDFITVRSILEKKFPSITRNDNLFFDLFQYLAKGTIPEALPVPFYRLTELCIDISCQSKKEVAAAFCLFKSAPNLKVLSLMVRPTN